MTENIFDLTISKRKVRTFSAITDNESNVDISICCTIFWHYQRRDEQYKTLLRNLLMYWSNDLSCPLGLSVESLDWAPSSSVPIVEKLDQSLIWSLPFSHLTTSHMDSTWRRYLKCLDRLIFDLLLQWLNCGIQMLPAGLGGDDPWLLLSWHNPSQRSIIWLYFMLFGPLQNGS